MSGKKGRSGGRNGSEKIRTAENADLVCELLREGHTLKHVARVVGCDASAICRWAEDDERDEREGVVGAGAFVQRYARARDAGYERLADDLIEISDADCTIEGKPDNALVQQRRLQVDTRKWLLSKMLPRRYGDRVTAEVVGDADRPLVTRIELVPIDPAPPPTRGLGVRAVLIEHDDGEEHSGG